MRPLEPQSFARLGFFLFAAFVVVLAFPGGARGEGGASPEPAPVSGSLEAGLARDRSQFNVVRIDDAAAVLVSDGATRRTETFRHLMGALNAAVPCTGIVRCTANASLDTHAGRVTNEVDTAIAQGDAGLQFRFDATTVGARYLRESWKVAGQRFRRVQGVAADVVVGVDEKVSAYALANVSRYRHPGEGAALDATNASLTGNLRYAPGDAWKSAWTGQLTISRERNAQRDRALDQRGAMVRLSWEATPVEQWEVKAAVIGQWVRFAEFDPLLGAKRADRFASVDLSVSRRIAADLQARLEWNHSLYRSRVAAFDNDYDSVGIALTWGF